MKQIEKKQKKPKTVKWEKNESTTKKTTRERATNRYMGMEQIDEDGETENGICQKRRQKTDKRVREEMSNHNNKKSAKWCGKLSMNRRFLTPAIA